MKIECHIIQNFPPHCLNRDDTNSPKDCEFGGVRRARISSQCFKRAVRDAFAQYQSFGPELRAVRTKRVVEQVVARLPKDKQQDPLATAAVINLLAMVDLKMGDSGPDKTQYLLFLPERKLEQLAGMTASHWSALTSVGASQPDAEDTKSKTKGKSKAKGKDAGDVPKEHRAEVAKLLLDSHQTPEIALFGRMIADNPDWNVEAACQVAQSISTHRVSMEFDFFTAVDDLKKDADSGSDMMGTVQFNSACFYRYSAVDYAALVANLGGTEQRDLSKNTVEAFLRAFVHARPTGKQNSMAAHTLPSLVLVTLRDGGQPLSLANAFAKPVTTGTGELESDSAQALAEHFRNVSRMYPGGLVAAYAAALVQPRWENSAVTEVASVDELIRSVCGHLISTTGPT